MRPDMAKVVTERERVRSSARNKKHGGRVHRHVYLDEDADGGPTFIPWSRRRNPNPKSFTDHLNPLLGWLRKQVNRPWNKVWSEICEHMDSRSLTGRHIIQHIHWEVERNCFEEGRVVYVNPRWAYGVIRPVEGLYVHPRTGLLRYAPKRRSRGFYHTRTGAEALASKIAIFKDGHEYRLEKNAKVLWEKTEHGWFMHWYGELDPKAQIGVKIVKNVIVPILRGPGIMGVLRSKQASKKELRGLPPA